MLRVADLMGGVMGACWVLCGAGPTGGGAGTSGAVTIAC